MASTPVPHRLLPRRDAHARAALAGLAEGARPVTGAHERVVPVTGPLGGLLPGGALRRGSVVVVGGPCGAGATSAALALAGAVTAVGEWAAAVDLEGSLGGRAAAEAGVALDRFAVLRGVPPGRFASVVAVLLEGMSLVLAELPRGLRPADARRLAARARERGSILVPCERVATWPAEATLRVRAEGGRWPGLGAGSGVLRERTVRIRVEGRGAAARGRAGALVLAG